MMEEIVKHINDTNASYRAPNAGDAKNTDLFLDNEHYELFRSLGEQITVRFSKKNLAQAILFIASILPRKYDNSSVHKMIHFSKRFVLEQLELLDAYFVVDGVNVENRTQIWNARKDVLQKNGKTDNRFYFNGLLEDFTFKDSNGLFRKAKFTIRNYLAGGFSDIHIKKGDDNIFDVWITNTLEPYDDGKETAFEDREIARLTNESLQQIFYGAPGTGKSHNIKCNTKVKEADEKNLVFRTTFHPDSDYSTFVGTYKPTMRPVPNQYKAVAGKDEDITYSFIPQAFLQAYVAAWNNPEDDVFLVIEEINRGNCAQIFGDLFQLLDRDNSGQSEYPIMADKDITKYLNGDDEEEQPILTNKEGIKDGKLRLPKNLYIWATMNTSDQSLFPIDSAFKRRWDWKYIPIDTRKEQWSIVVEGVNYSWTSFLDIVNERVLKATSSEDKQLGFYFCKAQNNMVSAETFVSKVLFYLWNDVFKDYDEGESIFRDSEGAPLPFSKFYTTDGNVNEAIVTRLLIALGIERSNADSKLAIEEEEDEDGNALSSIGKNYDKFSINGVGQYGKNRLATECVKKYIELNPNMNAEEVLANWKRIGVNVPHFIESKEEYDARTDNSKRSYEIPCGDTVVYVAHNGYGSNGKVDELINAVNNQNWGLTLAKVE